MQTQIQNSTGMEVLNSPKMGRREGADQLSFTGRDSNGFLLWWNIGPPQTDLWDDHVKLGEHCAKEVIGLLINDSGPDGLSHDCLAHIELAMQLNPELATQGVRTGFMTVISRALCSFIHTAR